VNVVIDRNSWKVLRDHAPAPLICLAEGDCFDPRAMQTEGVTADAREQVESLHAALRTFDIELCIGI
jgi:hypothetical protein